MEEFRLGVVEEKLPLDRRILSFVDQGEAPKNIIGLLENMTF